ncbi:MAG: hypothetical protein U5L45_12025 [Saprospiraceae bacterium]|nr:hypothetical protein [Saprospiraceae bacterium]
MVHFSGFARKMNHLFSCRCASKMNGTLHLVQTTSIATYRTVCCTKLITAKKIR